MFFKKEKKIEITNERMNEINAKFGFTGINTDIIVNNMIKRNKTLQKIKNNNINIFEIFNKE